MDMGELFEKRDAVMAEATIDSLVSGLIVLASEWSADTMTADVRLIHAWLCDELELRYPAITPALNKYAANPDERSYAAVVIDALTRVGALD
jgi:hypothetical protein